MVATATKQKTLISALENGVACRLQHALVELIDLGLHADRRTGTSSVRTPDRFTRDSMTSPTWLAGTRTRSQSDWLRSR